jgi:hypothetical protein
VDGDTSSTTNSTGNDNRASPTLAVGLADEAVHRYPPAPTPIPGKAVSVHVGQPFNGAEIGDAARCPQPTEDGDRVI